MIAIQPQARKRLATRHPHRLTEQEIRSILSGHDPNDTGWSDDELRRMIEPEDR